MCLVENSCWLQVTNILECFPYPFINLFKVLKVDFSVMVLCVGITQNGPYSLASACMPAVINRIQTVDTARNDKLVGMATGEDSGLYLGESLFL